MSSNGIAPNPLNGLTDVYLKSIREAAKAESPEKIESDRRKEDDLFGAPNKKKSSKKLDPVGQEDDDVDNDGDTDNSDEYLTKRRKAITASMKKRLKKESAESPAAEEEKLRKDDDLFGSPNKKKKKVKESFKSNWRHDLRDLIEIVDEPESKEQKEVTEKKVKNKVIINPQLGEAVGEMGGEVLSVSEAQKDTPLQVAAVIDKDRAKKATDDATYNRLHGKNKKADEDERYSEWERYKMKRDAQRAGDPWKHAKGSTTEKEGKKSVKSKRVYDPLHNKEEVVLEKDLNAAERRALPDSDFALPGKGKGPEGKQAGSYPIPDKGHARLALAMVAKYGTPEEKAKVRAAVAKKFPSIK